MNVDVDLYVEVAARSCLHFCTKNEEDATKLFIFNASDWEMARKRAKVSCKTFLHHTGHHLFVKSCTELPLFVTTEVCFRSS